MSGVTPEDRAVFARYAAAAEEGRQTRLVRLRGDLDHYDLLMSRSSKLRQAVAFFTLSKAARATGRFDHDAWTAAVADLRDDGQPDWVFFLEHPRRRYHLRPWRPSDGEPYSYRTPCITVSDADELRVLAGVPITGLRTFGISDRVEDTDEHAALWFINAKPRRAQ